MKMLCYCLLINAQQGIMQTLRQKAHVSLEEFREGKQSPLTSMLPYKPFEVAPEVDEGDELSKLGGKTRLISQKDSKTPSPLLTRSPNTQNPIVPLPLPDGSSSIHPSVLDYLSTFPLHAQGGKHDGQYQDRDMFSIPSSGLYRFEDEQGFPSHQLPTPTSASATNVNNALVLPSPHAHQQPGQPPQGASGNQAAYFPQYFPVFDYGSSSAYAAGPPMHASTSATPTGVAPSALGGMGYDQDHPMSYDGSSLHGRVNGLNGYAQKDPRDITPETSMHTTWMDLVSQMSGIN